MAGTGGTAAGSSATAGNASGGVSTAGTATSGGSASNGQGGDSGTGGSTAGAGHVGQVAVYNLLAQNYQSLTASFVKTSAPASTACELTTVGACSVSVCPENQGVNSAVYASAGVISVTSTEVMGSATLTPAADGTYSMPEVDFEGFFTGLEPIHFKATGGEVPAFDADLDIPLVLLLSSPPYVEGASGIDVQRSENLALTWTRGAESELLYINGGSARPDGQPGRASIACQFPSLPGNGTVDSTLLQKLAPGTGLTLVTTASKVVQAGDYAVTIVTVNSVANPDKVAIPNIHLL
jgi:hypothetical protein